MDDSYKVVLYRRACLELHESLLGSVDEDKNPDQSQRLYEYAMKYLQYLMVGGDIPAGDIRLDPEDRHHCRRMVDGLMQLPDIYCSVCEDDEDDASLELGISDIN